jgi:hypothetical protein
MTMVHTALVNEQGVNFAVVEVKRSVVDIKYAYETLCRELCLYPVFHVPIVACHIDSYGRAHYRGRPDIVKWLVNIDPRILPWRQITLY